MTTFVPNYKMDQMVMDYNRFPYMDSSRVQTIIKYHQETIKYLDKRLNEAEDRATIAEAEAEQLEAALSDTKFGLTRLEESEDRAAIAEAEAEQLVARLSASEAELRDLKAKWSDSDILEHLEESEDRIKDLTIRLSLSENEVGNLQSHVRFLFTFFVVIIMGISFYNTLY